MTIVPDTLKTSIRNYPIWKRTWDQLYAAITLGAWPARLAGRLAAPYRVGVEEYEVAVPQPLGDETRLRIAFASDFHSGPSTPWQLIEAGLDELRGLNASVVLFGGDFVGVQAAYARRLARLLEEVPAPLGKYAVLGNHDHWAGPAIVVRHLQEAGIEVLANRHVRLPPPFQGVSICGLDDHSGGEPDAAKTFAGAGDVRVLLMHGPSGLLDVDGQHFDLAVCGHTHGGQIALPGGRPLLVAHGRLSRQYNAGRFSLPGGRTLLVSRGVGCGSVPIRLNAPSSVMLFTLVGASSAAGVPDAAIPLK